MLSLNFGAALPGVGVPAVEGLFLVRLNPGVEPPPILRVIVGFEGFDIVAVEVEVAIPL
jgi:hypothetical protein